MPQGKHILGRAPTQRVFGTAKVGDRGQIVIPKEAREFFHIRPGDTLLLLADVNQNGLRNAQDVQRLYEQLTGTA